MDALALAASDPDDMDAERDEAFLDRPTDRAVPEDQHVRPIELVTARSIISPNNHLLNLKQLQQPTIQHKNHHHNPLHNPNIVHPARITQNNAHQKTINDPINANQQHLNDTKPVESRYR